MFELAMSAIVIRLPSELAVEVVDLGNPELGASFRDTPADGWRFELGGAVTLPTATREIVSAPPPPVPGMVAPLYPTLPLRNILNQRPYGWNAHRLVLDAAAVIAHARGEWDPIPQLVVALQVDLAMHVALDGGGVDFYPQAELTVAGRFLDSSLLGLRAELTTFGWTDFNVMLDPFVRLDLPDDGADAHAFLRASVRVPLGPSYRLPDSSLPGWLGASLELGVLH